MSQGPRPLPLVLLSGASLGGVFLLAPWPGPQGIPHAFLVLGLAPLFRSPLVGALWAAAAGWALEGSLRIYPHLGGTAFANLNLCLMVHFLWILWPPHRRLVGLAQLAGLTLLHLLAVHLCVHVAAGAHHWGTSWIWALAALPAWGMISLRLQRPAYLS